MTRRIKLLLGAVALVVLVAAGGLWSFFNDDAPAEASLTAAVESVSPETDTTEAVADGVTGTWVVDTESGEFDYDTATGTFAGFRIDEQLSGIGSATAVGRTGDVSGSITIDGTTVTAASFDVDLTTITTNESRRDDKVQQALATDTYPTATFTLTEPMELGDGAASGEPVAVVAVGDLTIHGVTQRVELPMEAQLVDGTVVVVGSLDVTFADFGVEVPSSPIVLSVEDHGVLEVQLLLVRG